jgi:hypothetical protein
MVDERPTEPDPRLIWRWAGDAIRPVLGWILTIVGAVALILGYLGVSGEVLVARQLPYVVSGGLAGIAMVFLGGIYLGAQDVRRSTERILRLERLVGELHAVLLTHPDVSPDTVGTGPVTRGATAVTDDAPTDQLAVLNGAGGELFALPNGSTFHRRQCAALGGKSAERLDVAAVEERSLKACKLCEPVSDLSGV